MSQAVTYGKWTIKRDREAGSEPVTHATQCRLCGDRSDGSGAWEPPQTWALDHFKSNPAHTSFVEIITTPFRVVAEGAQ